MNHLSRIDPVVFRRARERVDIGYLGIVPAYIPKHLRTTIGKRKHPVMFYLLHRDLDTLDNLCYVFSIPYCFITKKERYNYFVLTLEKKFADLWIEILEGKIVGLHNTSWRKFVWEE